MSKIMKIILILGWLLISATVTPRALADAPGFIPPHAPYAVQALESKIHDFLSNYLLPSEFSVVVRAKAVSQQNSAPNRTPSYLPGAPGMQGVKVGEAHSFYDDGGSFHDGAVDRPPMAIDIVLDSSIDPSKFNLLKNMLPKLAGTNADKGDELHVTTGKLERPPPKEPVKPQEPSIIDTLMKYKKEIVSLFFGLLAAIACLLLIHGIMNVLANKAKNNAEEPTSRKPEEKPELPENKMDPNQAQSRLGVDHNRISKFNREAMLYELVKEINDEALNNPVKIARLLTEWIQETKYQQAGAFINNFDMRTSEKIAEHMLPSEIDKMRPYMAPQSDPMAEENFVVLNEARQDLIRISARIKSESGQQQFAFLGKVDDEMLSELLRGESPMSFAMVSTLVPTSRITGHLRSLPESDVREVFTAMCNLGSLSSSDWAHLADKFKKKMDTWQGKIITESSKNKVILSLMNQLPGVEIQRKILDQLEAAAPELAKTLKESIFFFEDIIDLPVNYLRMIFLQIEPTVLSVALSGMEKDVIERLKGAMSAKTAEIVTFDLSSGRIHPQAQVEQAREQVVSALLSAVVSGTIDPKEVRKNQTSSGRNKAVA